MSKATLSFLLALPLLAFGLVAGWIWWVEDHPETERELRLMAQEQLAEWFPEGMSLPPELIGFHPPSAAHEAESPEIILVHGLDEPGGIWDDLAVDLAAAGWTAWEFRYPNDQAIDHSADLLAEYWDQLDSERVFLIGHSMGGLVIRDFVSRWRHPVGDAAAVAGPEVAGVILIATPSQGSEWARLRAWLELREWARDIPEGRFSLFASLRDGTGAAKIDLRPDSGFLSDLNARPWPQQIPRKIIGGRLAEPTSDMLDGLQVLTREVGTDTLQTMIEQWWRDTGEGIGDGAVAVDSLVIDGAPEPLILAASHRGLLVRMPWSDEDPPAIAPVIAVLEAWRDDQRQ